MLHIYFISALHMWRMCASLRSSTFLISFTSEKGGKRTGRTVLAVCDNVVDFQMQRTSFAFQNGCSGNF